MKLIYALMLLFGSVLLLGCDNDDEDVVLQGISITASYVKVPADITMQYTASGAYSDGGTADITNSVSWSSSDTAVATIASTGLLTSIATGETNINATAGGITSNTMPLSVEVITIDHLTVVPDTLILSLGTSENLQAFAVATNDESYDISTSVAWSSADTAVATIDANGLVAAISGGSSTMTASFKTFTATSAVTVQATSASDIRIEPANSQTVPDFLVQFKAFDVSTGVNITNDVTWSSDDITIADIGKDDGIAETGDVGTAVITATTAGGTTASTTLAVQDAELLSITITDPNSGRLPVGFGFLYTATGVYSNGFQPDMTKLVDWKADDDDIADFIDGTGGPYAGTVRAYAPGSTEVKATYGTLLGDVEGKTILTVTVDNLVSIDLQPNPHTVTLGDVFQYNPIGTFASGETLDLNQSVATKWRPADTAIVVVDGLGKAYAIGAGTTSVTVEYLLIASPPAALTVAP